MKQAKAWFAAFLGFGLSTLSGGAAAQAATDADAQLRSGPFTIYSALPPGGPVDLLARLLSEGLQKKYGQNSVVENVPGAGGNVALDRVRRTKADGHSLLVIAAGSLTINPTLMPNFPFNIERDFTLITMLTKAPNIMVTHPGSGLKNVQDVIAAAKAQPGKLQYATPGVGSGLHLAGELFKLQAGIDIMHVPYKGTGPALTDVLGRHMPLMLTNVPAVLPYLGDGRLVALGLTEAQRSPVVPNVPTFVEQGVSGVAVTSWYGLIAPGGTPPAVVAQLARDAAEILGTPAVQRQMAELGMVTATSSPAEFVDHVRNEARAWRDTIQSARIRLE